jgi:superfamily II DNA or RNA helicase
VLATHLIASRACSTLVLVHRKPLVEQWIERLCQFLDIPPKSIGRLGAGRRRLTQRIDIAMVQTLARSDDLQDLVRGYGHVVIDECPSRAGGSGRTRALGHPSPIRHGPDGDTLPA